MIQLIDSIKDNGLLVPALVRPNKEGTGYEMISGHRRHYASKANQLQTIPCIIRDLSDDQATIIMVDSNIQRENILPTERGHAYKMKLGAMNHQGKRNDLTFSQFGKKLKRDYSIDILSKQIDETKNQIYRYIRLTELIDPLKDMVDGLRADGKKIALNPAVELSYLTKKIKSLW